MACSNTRPVIHSQYIEYLERRIAKRVKQLEDWHTEFHRMQMEYTGYNWFKKLFATNPNNGRWDSEYSDFHYSKYWYGQHLGELRLTLKKVIYSRDIIGESHYMLEDDSKFWETLR